MAELAVADLIQALQMLERSKTRGMARGFKDVLVASPGETIYGTGLFSLCGDNDVVSALIRDEAFLRWLPWLPNQERNRFIKILSWEGPEGSSWDVMVPTGGYLSADCTPPNSVEWGKCEIVLSKGLYGRCGQDIAAINIDYKYCDKEPIYRIDGTVINNDAEWQLSLAANVLRDDISRHLITGNNAVAGQFDGLENLVKTGYVDARTGTPCTHVDSIVVDWNNASISGIADTIAEIVNRIKLRARSAGGVRVSQDMVIMLPAFLRDCLVNEFACEGPCATSGSATVMVIQGDARSNRDRYLVGGQFGDGWIPVNGEPISFLVNDWIPFQSCVGGGAGSFSSDIYILTRQLGNRVVLRGEYQSFEAAAAELARNFGSNLFRVTDGGRFLVYSKSDETCFNTCLLTRPGLYLSAPWVQARITDVCCTVNLDPIGPDVQTQYFLNYADLYQAVPPAVIAP